MIYCVEDERNIRELLVYTLSGSGYEAKGVANGKELKKALKEEIPDLILLGYHASRRRWICGSGISERKAGYPGYSRDHGHCKRGGI